MGRPPEKEAEDSRDDSQTSHHDTVEQACARRPWGHRIDGLRKINSYPNIRIYEQLLVLERG